MKSLLYNKSLKEKSQFDWHFICLFAYKFKNKLGYDALQIPP